MEYVTSRCKNCYRKMGTIKEVIQSPNTGEWVHNNRLYETKCNPFEQWVAEPWEE